MSRAPLRVGIVGCGLVGRKRAEALGPQDRIVGCTDVVPERAEELVSTCGGKRCEGLDDVLALEPDVVVVATSHDRLAPLAERALAGGAHVLVEKPAGLSGAQVQQLARTAAHASRIVKVGFNHRFHPGIARAADEVRSGRHGELLHVTARYGHGGRLGYEREWRADPARSGGGELIDQGMHLLDLVHWLAGPLPLHAAFLHTDFWDAPVEDNAVLVLGTPGRSGTAWASLHASWTEWKNTFSLEIACRTAKLQVDGLVGSYGPQRLRIHRMKPELGPPDLEEEAFPEDDVSWSAEWEHFAAALAGEIELMGAPADALYAWDCVERAYAESPFAPMREAIRT